MHPGNLSTVLRARNVTVQEQGDALEDALRARVAAGRAAWPALRLEEATFVLHLAERVHRESLPPLAHAADLWLACACLQGLPGASAEFDRAYRRVVTRAVEKIARADAEDTAQQVLVMMLAGQDGAPPRLVGYGGRASLRTWLSTVAARAAINRRGRPEAQPHASVSALADVAAGAEPELRMLRERYAADLEDALRAALESLEARDRVLLRLHHVSRWPVERLATTYRVGKSTAARWVSAARAALLAATKQRLRERLRLTAPEVESLLRVLHSDLMEVSLVRLLQQGTGP